MAREQSVSNVMQDIFRNLQDMVRLEIRLAKTEIREEVSKTVTSSVWLAAGSSGRRAHGSFLLWTLAYALATRMPMWAATLVIAVVMTAVAAVLIEPVAFKRHGVFSPCPSGPWNRSRGISNG